MLRVNKSSFGANINTFDLYQYHGLTNIEFNIIQQQISYDSPTKFEANLHVHANRDSLISLSFQYHPKDDKGNTLTLSIINQGDDKAAIICSKDGLSLAYILSGVTDKLSSLKEKIIEVNDYDIKMNHSQSVPQSEFALHIKDFLSNIGNLARGILRADKHDSFVLNMINNIYDSEILYFKNAIALSNDTHTPNFRN